MSDIEALEQETALETNWRTRVLLVGGVLGALVGLGAAYLYIQNTEEGGPPQMTAGQGVKLGVLLLGLLRNIATLGD